jgi:rfaE bifunctional protein nucleotidyltransferase chain/domain
MGISFRAVEEKLKRRSELAEAVTKARAEGKTVVFTNGCFDILHVGHVRYLQDARALGDLLVVGVNTDDSVRRLKGPTRPVVSEWERAEILAALQCVDYVSLFNEDTPVELITAIRPSIHVKGGDYKVEDLPEAEAVIAGGGKIVIVSFSSTDSEGFSTTNVIGKIMNERREKS